MPSCSQLISILASLFVLDPRSLRFLSSELAGIGSGQLAENQQWIMQMGEVGGIPRGPWGLNMVILWLFSMVYYTRCGQNPFRDLVMQFSMLGLILVSIFKK